MGTADAWRRAAVGAGLGAGAGAGGGSATGWVISPPGPNTSGMFSTAAAFLEPDGLCFKKIGASIDKGNSSRVSAKLDATAAGGQLGIHPQICFQKNSTLPVLMQASIDSTGNSILRLPISSRSISLRTASGQLPLISLTVTGTTAPPCGIERAEAAGAAGAGAVCCCILIAAGPGMGTLAGIGAGCGTAAGCRGAGGRGAGCGCGVCFNASRSENSGSVDVTGG